MRAMRILLVFSAVAAERAHPNHKKFLPPMHLNLASDCSNLPGTWTGGFGKTCGDGPIGDAYRFSWTLPRLPGAWTATMLSGSGGGWSTGLARNSADNSTTVISLDVVRCALYATRYAVRCMTCVMLCAGWHPARQHHVDSSVRGVLVH